MTNQDKPDVAEILKGILGDNLEMSAYQSKKIINCDKCNGIGFTEREELSCYHRGEYNTHHDQCRYCEGDGRLTQTKTLIQFQAKYPHGRSEIKTKSTVPYSKDPIKEPATVFSTYNQRIPYLEHFKNG